MTTHYLKTTTSSMDELKHLAQQGAPTGTTVVAEKQTKGRGQQGKPWFSDENSLTFSILYRPDKLIKDIARLTKKISNTVIDSIQEIINISVQLKLPNDLLVNNKKIGGILIEATTQGENTNYLIIGIGLNINNKKFPDDIKDIASSLKIETGKTINKEVLLNKIRDKILNN